MSDSGHIFTLEPGRWYAYEMLPGYGKERYYSPILIEQVEPLKSGRNVLRVAFHNACYAAGVQGFQLDLKVLHRGEAYLLARIEHGGSSEDRCAVIGPITWRWLDAHFGVIVRRRAAELGLGADASIDEIVAALFL